MPAPEPITVPLSIDEAIATEIQKGSARILVTGPAKSGMSSTAKRVKLDWEPSGYKVVDVPHPVEPTSLADLVGSALKSERVIVFLRDYWKRVAEIRPELAGEAAGLLERLLRDFKLVEHLLKESDIEKVIDSSFARNELVRDHINKELRESIKKLAKVELLREGKRHAETYAPQKVVEAVASKIEQLEKVDPEVARLFRTRSLDKEQKAKVKDAQESWKKELERSTLEEESLSVALLGSTVSLTSASTNFANSVRSALGQAMPDIASKFISVAVPGSGFLGAAIALLARRKSEATEKFQTAFKEYNERFLRFRDHWNRISESAEGEILCYELDRVVPQKLGSARDALDGLYMARGTGGEDLTKRLEKELEPYKDRLNKHAELLGALPALTTEMEKTNERMTQLETIVQELEAKVDRGFRSIREELSRVDEEMHRTYGISLTPNSMNLDKDETGSWFVLGQNHQRISKLVTVGSFVESYKALMDILAKDSSARIVVRGPKGIGKSVLVAYVLSNLIQKGYFVVDAAKPLRGPWRETGSVAEQRAKVGEILQKGVDTGAGILRLRGVVVLDPSGLTVGYQELASGMGISASLMDSTASLMGSHAVSDLLELALYYRQSMGFPIIAVIPDDLYEASVQVFARNEFNGYELNLNDSRFLRDVLRAYSGIDQVPDELVDETSRFSGYTLAAARAGELFREGGSSTSEIMLAAKGDIKDLLRSYIWKGILKGDERRARQFIFPLLFHVAYDDHFVPIELATRLPLVEFMPTLDHITPFPREVQDELLLIQEHMGSQGEKTEADRTASERKLELVRVQGMIERVRQDAKMGAECLEPELADWVSTPKEDLVEETLRGIVFGAENKGAERLSELVSGVMGNIPKPEAKGDRPYDKWEQELHHQRELQSFLVKKTRPLFALLAEQFSREVLLAYASSVANFPNYSVRTWSGGAIRLLCVDNEIPESVDNLLRYDERFETERLPLKLQVSNPCKHLTELLPSFGSSDGMDFEPILSGMSYLASLEGTDCQLVALKWHVLLNRFFRRYSWWSSWREDSVEDVLSLGYSHCLAALEAGSIELVRWGLGEAAVAAHGWGSEEKSKLVERLGHYVAEQDDWITKALLCKVLIGLGDPSSLSLADSIISASLNSAHNNEGQLVFRVEFVSRLGGETGVQKTKLEESARELISAPPTAAILQYVQFLGYPADSSGLEDWKKDVIDDFHLMFDLYRNGMNYYVEHTESEIDEASRVLTRFRETFACEGETWFPVSWAPVVADLITELEPFRNRIVVTQLKEKWGGLKLYFDAENRLVRDIIERVLLQSNKKLDDLCRELSWKYLLQTGKICEGSDRR